MIFLNFFDLLLRHLPVIITLSIDRWLYESNAVKEPKSSTSYSYLLYVIREYIFLMSNGCELTVVDDNQGRHNNNNEPSPHDASHVAGLGIGVCSEQGRRPYQEDEYAVSCFHYSYICLYDLVDRLDSSVFVEQGRVDQRERLTSSVSTMVMLEENAPNLLHQVYLMFLLKILIFSPISPRRSSERIIRPMISFSRWRRDISFMTDRRALLLSSEIPC